MYRFSLLELIILMACADAAKILGILPFYGTSHNLVSMPLFEELAKKGHHVTVAGFVEPKTPHENYKKIMFKPKPGTPLKGFLEVNDYANSNYGTTMQMFDIFVEGYDELIKINNFNQIFQGKYDLVIVELFETDLFMGYVSKLGAPFIVLQTCDPFPWHKDNLADPMSPSFMPHVFGKGSKGAILDFSERFWNTVEIAHMMIHYRSVTLPRAQEIARKHLGDLPPLNEVTKNASLYLVNSHNSIYGSRPYNPSTIEIGGLHVFPPKPLQKDLKELLDGSKKGVVYFSMGSVLKGSSMKADKRDAILKVFSQLEQTVLWKWEEDLPDKPLNLHTSPWFPQRDILAHPNVVLFIGHCGLLGIHEAVTEAVPIICLPMFGDQHFNAAALKRQGMGLWLNYADINEDIFRDTINQVLKNPSFKENAKRVSLAFLDRPMSALDTAVYWVEYVIRHKGAYHLRSPARWMTWYEYYNLDVLAVLAAIPILILVLLYKMLAAFIRTICCRGPGSAKKMKTK